MLKQTKAKCPDCQNPLDLPKEVEVGEIVECDNCGAEMEILSLKPLKMEILEEEK